MPKNLAWVKDEVVSRDSRGTYEFYIQGSLNTLISQDFLINSPVRLFIGNVSTGMVRRKMFLSISSQIK